MGLSPFTCLLLTLIPPNRGSKQEEAGILCPVNPWVEWVTTAMEKPPTLFIPYYFPMYQGPSGRRKSFRSNLKCLSLELLRQYQQSPSIKLRNQIAELNVGLVRKEAYRWLSRYEWEDLVQIGSLGLIRAIERFEISKGYAFSSFAIPFIRGEISHYLRDKGTTIRIPRRWTDLQHQVNATYRSLFNQLHRPPTDEEIASVLKIDLSELRQAKTAISNLTILSLDAPVQEDYSAPASLGEILSSPSPFYPSQEEDYIHLYLAIMQLEKPTRQILEFVFLEELSQRETAKRLGMSSITISRHIKKGLKYLRSIMTAQVG